MSDADAPTRFELTPRQRRLRTLTWIILAVVFLMIGFALYHPFFHPVRPPHLTPTIRKALAVQGLFILGYVGVIFMLAVTLVVVAWLYSRDVRLQLALAQRDLWRNIADEHQKTSKELKIKGGDGRDGA